MNKLNARVRAATHEAIEIVPSNPRWPELFSSEAARLRAWFPHLIQRIEHFGSTAVPGLAGKPIIDMLVKVSNLSKARPQIASILQSRGYEYFWRPTFGDDVPPWYAFFIKRDAKGTRTHHIHVLTGHRRFREHWDRLRFRDYLIVHPTRAREYERLKRDLAANYPNDRAAYTKGKRAFIAQTMAKVRRK